MSDIWYVYIIYIYIYIYGKIYPRMLEALPNMNVNVRNHTIPWTLVACSFGSYHITYIWLEMYSMSAYLTKQWGLSSTEHTRSTSSKDTIFGLKAWTNERLIYSICWNSWKWKQYATHLAKIYVRFPHTWKFARFSMIFRKCINYTFVLMFWKLNINRNDTFGARQAWIWVGTTLKIQVSPWPTR